MASKESIEDSDLMCNPDDGKEWKKLDENYLDFAREWRNVRLGFAADVFNPLGNMSSLYSMWLVVVTVYNLPQWLSLRTHAYKLLTY